MQPDNKYVEFLRKLKAYYSVKILTKSIAN